MSTAAVIDMTPKHVPADVPVRHMAFNFDAGRADDRFYLQAELASAYFEALSIFLTYGEDLVIDTARHHQQFLTDPKLRQRVSSLIGQEAVHSRVHNEWNEVLAQHRFPVAFYRYLADKVFEYGFKQLPDRMQLSMMAGVEHFTAVLAEFMMKHEENFFGSDDEQQRALWMWHMLEESEHKDIAYDVYQTLSGSYPLRIAGFIIAAVTIVVLVPFAGSLIPVIRKPSNVLSLTYWRDVKRSAGLLFGSRDGLYGSTVRHVLDYLRPDFHPNDHDTTAYLEYYKKRLLDPETGLLAPYFVREFVPPLRA